MGKLRWALAAIGAAAGCEAEPPAPIEPAATSETTVSSSASSAAAASPLKTGTLEGPTKTPLVLIAGGDVSFGRLRGNRLLREPGRDDFAPVRKLLDAADLRFVNLESTISDQGETQSPINQLVFTAPPLAADALARANIDIVSLANNHAWDYGRDALFETFRRLDAAGVAYVGAGKSRREAYAPRIVEANGQRIAFVAVTDIWNQEFEPHPGKEYVADAVTEPLVAAVKQARAMPGVDRVVVSHHGGYEYVDQPHEATRALLRASIDAGADAVLGHHPHVVQRVAFHRGRPILYSLGNFLMRMVTGKPWTEFGMLARLTFAPGREVTVTLCPYHVDGFDPLPFVGDEKRAFYERVFRFTFDRLQRAGATIDPPSGAELGPFGDDGCATIRPIAPATTP
jgi:poly-gamma-glutamate capsule biosynthesis protein CapA/YwtB (metallophosphatase superfamily)